jgi:ABC transporter
VVGSECHLNGRPQGVPPRSSLLEPGQSVEVVGPSGSGKSSLLYCLSGLERPSSGEVVFDGQDVGRMSTNERAELRLRSFSFVVQSADLVPELTLRDNIALALELAGVRRRAIRVRVSELVEALGFGDCAERRVAQVSGGQAQRAAVARAVVASPLSSSPTSRPGPWTPAIVRSCSTCCSSRCQPWGRCSSWSRTTTALPVSSTASSRCKTAGSAATSHGEQPAPPRLGVHEVTSVKDIGLAFRLVRGAGRRDIVRLLLMAAGIAVATCALLSLAGGMSLYAVLASRLGGSGLLGVSLVA